MSDKYTEDDSPLAAGMNMTPMFDSRTSLQKHQRPGDNVFVSELETLSKQLQFIDDELRKTVSIRDFAVQLGAMPSDIPEESLRTKFELRLLNYNQLLDQRGRLVSYLESFKLPTPPQPQPEVSLDPVRIYVQQTVPEPPRGFKSIWKGVRDIFTGRLW